MTSIMKLFLVTFARYLNIFLDFLEFQSDCSMIIPTYLLSIPRTFFSSQETSLIAHKSHNINVLMFVT